jgi:alkylation response protein AidB-like acyl-CoA dehydrogenase
VCAGVAVSYAANSLGSYALLEYGSEEQRQKYLPGVARGKTLAAFALTEESAGSDASAIKTTATRTDKGYVLNGTKLFITNGGEADIYTVIALTDKERGVRGASVFLVEKDTPGFSFGRKEKKLGIRTSATRELVFEDCLIPAENIIGREGAGFPMIIRLFNRSRPVIGAQAVGLAQGALEAALDYARNRTQFEHPIISFQAIQHMLANMATDIEAARALVYGAARTIDSGAKDFGMESSMAKVFASDVAMRVTTDAVQIFGGVGYMRDYPVEKMMRDAKITQIYEGTNQILRNVIASELRKKKTL